MGIFFRGMGYPTKKLPLFRNHDAEALGKRTFSDLEVFRLIRFPDIKPSLFIIITMITKNFD